MTTTVFNSNQIPTTAAQRAQYFRQISMRYTNDGIDRIKRHAEYCSHPETISSNQAVVTVVVASAVLFAKAGKVIGKQIEKIIFRDETEGTLGGYIGGGTGLVLGACAGGYTYMTFIEQTKNYKAWLKLKLENTIQEALTFSHSTDPILETFCCPVSLCIMNIPAHTPGGVLYDFGFLMNCPKEGNGMIKDPFKNPSFREDEIILNLEMAFFIKKRIHFLLKEDLEALKNDPEAMQAVGAQLNNVEKTMKLAYEKSRDLIEERRRDKTVSAAEYKNEIEEFEKCFGVDENQALDWTLDWKNILTTRFQHFNPEAKVIQ
jgi:hypothetical protein